MDVMTILAVFLVSVINFLPSLAAAIVLLIIGWAVGILVGKLTKEVMTRLKVDKYLAKNKKPLFSLTDILSVIFRWSIYLVFIQAAVEALGVAVLVTFLSNILGFIPKLIRAILLVVVGYGVAEYVREQIEASKLSYSDIISKLLFFLIVYIAIAMALPLMGIETFIVNAVLLVIVGSVGLGLAIAIGWGLRDTIAAMAKKYERKLR
jgi:hypothetical protein